jgi:hypothetical protein
MMVAQIKEVMKGLNTQKLAAISAPMNRTARVMRVISLEAFTLLFVISSPFAFLLMLSIPSLYGKEWIA